MAKNRWISDLHWRRDGQQSRSEQTQDALLDAAEMLILENGIEQTSVAKIAERAGASVGAVYHHFKDKEALLYAVFHRMTEDFITVSEQAVDPARWEGASIHDILSAFVTFSLTRSTDRPDHKAAALVVAAANPDLRDHYAELLASLYRSLHTLLLQRRAEIGHPHPDDAVAFVLDQLGAMLRARLDPAMRATQLDRRPDAAFGDDLIAFADTYLDLKPTQGD